MELAKRKLIRLKDYDYSQNGAYFVTICTYNKECIFGGIKNGLMELSKLGQIAYKEILNTNEKRCQNNIILDKFVVMPNRIHLIIIVGSRLAVTENRNRFSSPVKNSLASIIGGYKSSVTRNFNKLYKADMASHVPTVWQPRYHDHVIRDKAEYQKIWEYIDTNPLKWELDCYHMI